MDTTTLPNNGEDALKKFEQDRAAKMEAAGLGFPSPVEENDQAEDDEKQRLDENN